MAKQSFDEGTHTPYSFALLIKVLIVKTEMLTPIDQTLDKLNDLTPEEMYVLP